MFDLPNDSKMVRDEQGIYVTDDGAQMMSVGDVRFDEEGGERGGDR